VKENFQKCCRQQRVVYRDGRWLVQIARVHVGRFPFSSISGLGDEVVSQACDKSKAE